MEASWVKNIAAFFGALGAYLWGAWDALIAVLVAVVVIDYITGVTKAIIKKELDSGVGFTGLLKKIAIFLIVALAVLIDKAIPGTNGAARAATIMFYIANEGISILENIGLMGVPLPGGLQRWLSKLKDDAEQDISK